MLFQMMSDDGQLVLVPANWAGAYLELGYAFFLSPGK